MTETDVQRLTFLEALTECDGLPDYEGFWMAGKIPGQAWARTLQFTAKGVKPDKQEITYNSTGEEPTRLHAGYLAVLTAGMRANEDKAWSVTIFDSDLRCPMTRALTAFHEASHLRFGFGGSEWDEGQCDAFAKQQMKRLFGERIAKEIRRRRDEGQTCWNIPGLQERAIKMQEHDREAVRDFGMLIQFVLLARQNPNRRRVWAGQVGSKGKATSRFIRVKS